VAAIAAASACNRLAAQSLTPFGVLCAFLITHSKGDSYLTGVDVVVKSTGTWYYSRYANNTISNIEIVSRGGLVLLD
jgi:hypothetical protein